MTAYLYLSEKQRMTNFDANSMVHVKDANSVRINHSDVAVTAADGVMNAARDWHWILHLVHELNVDSN